MGKQEASPSPNPWSLGAQVASGGSASFPCRGTDELLGVTDQVTIINSTLGKALGGASGTCRVMPLGSPYPQAGPWRSLRAGGEGRLGRYRRGQCGLFSQEGLGVGSGSWPLTSALHLTSALVLRGLHDRA